MKYKFFTISISVIALSYLSNIEILYAAPTKKIPLATSSEHMQSIVSNSDNNVLITESITEKLLRQEISLQKQHASELMSMLLWSLGFSATFLISLTALVGFITDRRYKQDKESLEAMLKAEQKSLKGELDTAATLWQTAIYKEFEIKHSSIVTSLEKIAEDISARNTKELDRKISSLTRQTTDLLTTSIELKAQMYVAAGNHPLAVTQYLKLAEHALKNNIEYVLTSALEDLAKGIKKGGYFSADEKVRAASFLEALPPKFKPLGIVIQKELEKS